jgi:hypothetical protein
MSTSHPTSARPEEIYAALLAALEAAEGRSRRRSREAFQEWLLHCALTCAQARPELYPPWRAQFLKNGVLLIR